MPYISELLNNTITDSSDSTVGKLQDILIGPKEESFSPLKYLMVKAAGQIKFVPYKYVANFNSSQISLKNLFASSALSELPAGEQFIYLKKDILDKQIVDVVGTRVVRVNDLRIGNFEDFMCVLGIDPSFRGLLRRLGIVDFLFAKIFTVKLIDWRQAKLLESNGPLQLTTEAEGLSRLHPADLANIVEELDVKQGSRLLASLEASEAAKVLEEISPELQNVLVKYLGPEAGGKILQQMSSDEVADLVKSFTSKEAEKFMSKLEALKAKGVAKLVNYPDNSAGGLMTLDFVSVRPESTVAEVTEVIKKLSPSFRSIVFVYVTAASGEFFGVVSLRRLLIADAKEVMKKLLKKVPTVSVLHPLDRIRSVLTVMTKYNLYTAAVVDDQKKLVGVVTIDDVMRHLFPEA